MKGQDIKKREFEINGVENSEVSSAVLKIPEICLVQAKELQGSSAEMGCINDSSGPCDSSHPTASSSGRSGEIAADTGSGIEGILTGLEKQRNWSLGLKVKGKGKTSLSNENVLHTTVLNTAGSCYPCKNEAMLSLENSTVAIQDNMVSNPRRANNRNTMPKLNGVKSSLEPYTWRMWSIQRADFSDNDFEDDWEFQENEIMKAQDKLRSLPARFAVLEGKVALAKIDTQKVIDEKQERINNACKAPKLLRSTCVIWPNSASEVFLTGSFDGWATQRKMEKFLLFVATAVSRQI